MLTGARVSQAPKEEKAEEREQSGLTTLFPGQKRRVSHLSKHGKGVSAHTAVRDPRLWDQSRGFLRQTRVQHSLCPGREVLGVHVHSSPSYALCRGSGAQSRESEMWGSPPTGSHCPVPVSLQAVLCDLRQVARPL